MRRRKPERMKLDAAELVAIVDRTKTSALEAEDYEKLKAAVETLLWTQVELEKKDATLERLRKALSINTKKTEKTSEVLKGAGGADEERSGEKPEKKKKKPKGHGRNGADAYEGAEKVQVPHESLKPGNPCPECKTGKVYVLQDPRKT